MSTPPSARDYLANERTFLAYLRTALAFVGFGFVVARFSLFARELQSMAPKYASGGGISIGLGIAMAFLGVVVAIFGAVRYVQQDRALREDRFAALPAPLAIGITVAVAIFGAIIAYNLIRLR